MIVTITRSIVKRKVVCGYRNNMWGGSSWLNIRERAVAEKWRQLSLSTSSWLLGCFLSNSFARNALRLKVCMLHAWVYLITPLVFVVASIAFIWSKQDSKKQQPSKTSPEQTAQESHVQDATPSTETTPTSSTQSTTTPHTLDNNISTPSSLSAQQQAGTTSTLFELHLPNKLY